MQTRHFSQGRSRTYPLADSSVDVVISSCVINLAEDKGAVNREAFRVLRPGGRLAVADMVELEPLDAEVKKSLDAWAGCLSGTIPVTEYRNALVSAGLQMWSLRFTRLSRCRTSTARSAELISAPAGHSRLGR